MAKIFRMVIAEDYGPAGTQPKNKVHCPIGNPYCISADGSMRCKRFFGLWEQGDGKKTTKKVVCKDN